MANKSESTYKERASQTLSTITSNKPDTMSSDNYCNEQLNESVHEYSVSEISSLIKSVIEEKFNVVMIRGEISGLMTSSMGHVYFSLKDSKSIISSVCWKYIAKTIPIKLEDGMEVVCTGKVSTYGPRSSYQLIVSFVRVSGVGTLLVMLEKRKKLLEQQGYFDVWRKKAIPKIPSRIAVITSIKGAVIKDIIHRITERFPLHVMVWDVMVQGNGASEMVSNAISGLNNLPSTIDKPDVIIVARGGGSIEDLWCFNDENLIKTVADSKIPIISAVGHETDTTLIDYASDLRAPTPTAAAEKATPVKDELYDRLSNYINTSTKVIETKIQDYTNRLSHCSSVFARQTDRIAGYKMMLDNMQHSLNLALSYCLKTMSSHIVSVGNRLNLNYISNSVLQHEQNLHSYFVRSNNSLLQIHNRYLSRYDNLSSLLDSYSYERVLDRGFALVRKMDDGKVIQSSKEVASNDELTITLRDGKISTKVL